MDDKTLLPSAPFDDSQRPSVTGIHSLAPHHPSPTSYKSTSTSAIASDINHNDTMERKNPMDISNTLMSPPEAVLQDSFALPSIEAKMKTQYPMPTGRFQPPLSPPISPASKTGAPDASNTIVVRDPILFPNTDTQSAPLQSSLFPDTDAQRVVDQHIRAVPAAFFPPGTSRPEKQDYLLAIQLKSQTMKLFQKNPNAYLARERNFLIETNRLKNERTEAARKYARIAPATSNGPRAPRAKQGRSSGHGNIVKPYRQPKPARGVTPEGKVKATRHDDNDFDSVPNYCPPLDSLPAKHNSLKVDWKPGAPMPLTGDPHIGLLHPDEVLLAANLRLTCAMYLTSKRRIFQRRLEKYRSGKEFRKTDAQQACKIDVNKASKLWQAFDKVGWLDPKHMQEYL